MFKFLTALFLTLFIGVASASPYIDVTSGDNGCPVAVGNNTNDDRPAIQCQVDYLATNKGGGFVYFPPGKNFKITAPVVLKKTVTLIGSSRYTTAISASGDIIAVYIDATCEYCGIRDLFISGYQNAAASQPAVYVLYPAKTMFSNCFIWGGSYALRTAGFDGRMYNCDVQSANSGGVGIYSVGANFYTDVKIDNISSAFAGFYQHTCASTVCENHFQGADFSGPYTHSIYIDDVKAVTVIAGGIYSSPVTQIQGKALMLTGSEFGAAITNNSGALAITGSYAFSSTTVTGSGSRACAANINITC